METISNVYFKCNFFLSQCVREHFSFLCSAWFWTIKIYLTDLIGTDAAASDPYDVDSDEEKDLLKGIKDDIKDMVS